MNKAQILFVGDFDKSFLKQINCDSWEITHKETSAEAIAVLDRTNITLIIAKDKIEPINGYQLCLLVKSNPNTYNLPFYILGEKKQKGASIAASLFARPNRLAEYSEVIKKPQSLAKLIKEDLKDFAKNVSGKSKQNDFFPACNAAEFSGEIKDKINSELLLERFVSIRMLGLLRWPKVRSQYLNDAFIAFGEILKTDLCGIAISHLHKPWLAFSGGKNLNQQSFDTVVTKVRDHLVVAREMTLLSSPPLTEKEGQKFLT